MTSSNQASKRVIAETLRLYEATLARPLDEKQLARPTFKLIQDVVKSLITETRILRNVFNPSDLETENKTYDKRRKIEFVQKLIDFVANHERPVVGCVAAKLVAGLDPNKTNELIQALAEIAQAKISGHESNPNRPRTFTKQVTGQSTQPPPRPTGTPTVKSKANTSKQVSQTTRQSNSIARAIESSGQPAGATSLRRASGERQSRATSGASTRTESARSVPRGSTGGRQVSPPCTDDIAHQKLDGATNSSQQVAGDSKSKSISPGEPIKPTTTKESTITRQSTTVRGVRSSSDAMITSESDIGKHMQQLRTSLRLLGPVLMDISEFTLKLRERLHPE